MIMLTLLSGLAGSPAHAADEIGLSWDGQHWSDNLTGSLFDESLRWVPGDERTNDFYIRNNANDDAVLTIVVESKDRDRLLRNGDVTLTARFGQNDWIELDHVGPAFRLTQQTILSRDSKRIQVRAAFDPASKNHSQRDELALNFRVTLSDATSSPGGEPEGDDDGNGWLPDTGMPAMGWLIVFVGVALGTGLALMRRGRREGVGDGTAR